MLQTAEEIIKYIGDNIINAIVANIQSNILFTFIYIFFSVDSLVFINSIFETFLIAFSFANSMFI